MKLGNICNLKVNGKVVSGNHFDKRVAMKKRIHEHQKIEIANWRATHVLNKK